MRKMVMLIYRKALWKMYLDMLKKDVITLLAVVHSSPTETGADGAVFIAPARESKAEKKSLT